MATSMPFQVEGKSFNGYATVAVVGATFVRATSTTNTDNNFGIAPCAAAGAKVGVAAQDCPVGSSVTVWSSPGIITEVTVAGGNLTAGTEVQSDASGNAVAYSTGIKLGIVMSDTNVGLKAPIKLY